MITDPLTYRQWLADGAALPITIMRDTEWDRKHRVYRTKAWFVCVPGYWDPYETVAEFSTWEEAMEWADFIATITTYKRKK